MATNPRIPEDRDDRLRPMVVDKPPRPRSVWPMVIAAIIAAAVLLGIIMARMPSAPKAAPASNAGAAQMGNESIAVQNVQFALSPDGNSAVMQGTITNSTDQVVNGVQLGVDFKGDNGAVVGTQEGPVELLQTEGKGAGATVKSEQPLGATPLQPNESRPFRMNINRVPMGWNHQQPTVRVLTTTGTTK